MRIVHPHDHEYKADCVLANDRFFYLPRAIYFCENAADVKTAIADSGGKSGSVRIRSGGHHHEGMSSANGVLLIDVSSINEITYDGKGRVWIGAGASLKSIYGDLWQHGYMFPGGGCLDVHVGGLAQGGGWGPVSRKFGLTCDSLVGVEMVTAEGHCVTALQEDRDEDHRKLLRALRGGGGGNFGVITKFCFRLHPWSEPYTDVTLVWSDRNLPGEKLDQFVSHWLKSFPRDPDHNLTTFLRLTAVDDPGGDRLVLGGRYLGNANQAEARINALLAGQPSPRTAHYDSTLPWQAGIAEGAPGGESRQRALLGTRLGTLPEYQPGPTRASKESADGAKPDVTDTCGGIPLRHKLSSGFAVPQFDPAGIRAMTDYIRQGGPWPDSRLYVSLHCLGGAIVSDGDGSAFAFRDRNVLLQYQAWWLPEAASLDGLCIGWIGSFRRAMEGHTDGSFINFIDARVPLGDYYHNTITKNDKVPQLVAAKRRWDPGNFFRFEMGIPPE